MHERTIIVLHIKILAMDYVKVNFVFDYENLFLKRFWEIMLL